MKVSNFQDHIKYLLMKAIAIMLTSKISIRLTINRQQSIKMYKKSSVKSVNFYKQLKVLFKLFRPESIVKKVQQCDRNDTKL